MTVQVATDTVTNDTQAVNATVEAPLLADDSKGDQTVATSDTPVEPVEGTLLSEGAETKPEETKEQKAEGTTPDTYEEFSLPEGMVLDQPMLDGFLPVARELKLSQDAAQKLVDVYSAGRQAEDERIQADFQAQREEWRGEVRAMPEHEKHLALAKKAIASDLASEDFRKLVSAPDSWLGDHPAVVGFLANVGAMISEDSFLHGTTRSAPKDTAHVLFPTMK